MRRVYFLFGTIIGILVIAGGILIFYNKKAPDEVSMNGQSLSGKKIVMVIAFRDFRDEEYFVPKEILEKAGAEIKTAANETGQALGADGGQVNVDYKIDNIDLNNFDAVVFVGGPGTFSNLDNVSSYNLARQTLAKNKVLAAICVSPAILAKAGVLKNKAATVWSSALDKSAIEILEQNGADYQAQDVVTDGKIITANGPSSAKKFADTLIEILK